MSDVQALADHIDQYFQSGNGVPVERAHIKASDWGALRAAIAALQSRLSEPAAAPQSTTTGWPPGMLQDDSRELSRWLGSKPDAMQHARDAAEMAAAPQSGPSDTDERLWREARHAVEKLKQADLFVPPILFGERPYMTLATRLERSIDADVAASQATEQPQYGSIAERAEQGLKAGWWTTEQPADRAQRDELPPLPAPYCLSVAFRDGALECVLYGPDSGLKEKLFTAEQMREYAALARKGD